MNQPTEQTQFMRLRANGWSLGKISQKLNIPKSTLFGWECQHRAEIHALKSMQVEKLQETYTPSYEEELQHLAAYLIRIEKALQKQDFEQMRPEFLLRTALNLRHRFNKLRIDVPINGHVQRSGLDPIPVGGCLSRNERPVLANDYEPVDSTVWLQSSRATSPSRNETTGLSPSPPLEERAGERRPSLIPLTDAPASAREQPTALPLPQGEGRGEGEETVQTAPRVQLDRTDNDEMVLTECATEPPNRNLSNGSRAPESENSIRTNPHDFQISSKLDASSSAPCNTSSRTVVRNSTAPANGT